MRAYITGGSGFIGSHLRHVLARNGHSVIAPEHNELDITNARAVAESVSSSKPDWVFHLAGRTKGTYEALKEVNVTGTQNILVSAAHCRAIVVAGSIAEYGNAPIPLHEHSPTHPLTPYARTKCEASMMALESHSSVTVVRISNVYGPGETQNFMAHALRAIRAGSNVRVNASIVRDFVHVEDVASAMLKVAERIDVCRERVINISSGDPHTMPEIASFIARRIGIDPGTFVAPEPYIIDATEQLSNEALNETAKQLLDWNPRPLYDGLSYIGS